MRLASVRHGDAIRLAAVLGSGEDLAVALLPEPLGSLDDVVRGGPSALEAAREALPSARVLPASEVGFAPPLRRFNRDILCTGWNYLEHFEESPAKRGGQGPQTLPSHPTFFTKAPGAAIGPYEDIAFDQQLSSEWDYEAEIAVVIGRDGRSIPEDRALEHVFGYCVANDVSQRDLQRAHGGQWMKGKSVDGTTPIGPWISTPDEIDDIGALTIQCEVNGVRLQDAVTSQMAYPFGRLIAELSWGMTLHAGDVILTGTPSGVGSAREPKSFLAAGDVVITRVSGLGELRNRISPVRLT